MELGVGQHWQMYAAALTAGKCFIVYIFLFYFFPLRFVKLEK